MTISTEMTATSHILTTPDGDRIAFDRRGSGPALIFIAGAGIYREIDPWTTSHRRGGGEPGHHHGRLRPARAR